MVNSKKMFGPPVRSGFLTHETPHRQIQFRSRLCDALGGPHRDLFGLCCTSLLQTDHRRLGRPHHCEADQIAFLQMKGSVLPFSPHVVASSLMFAAEVIAQWQAGKVVVWDKTRVTVDGKDWVPSQSGPAIEIAEQVNTFKFLDGKWTIAFEGKESMFKD